MDQLLTMRDSIVLSVNQGVTHFLSVVPTLLGALCVLVVGWVSSSWIAAFVDKALVKLGFERAVRHSGIAAFIERSGTSFTTSGVVAELSKWFVRLIFIQAAASVLAMPQISLVINNIIMFIPKLAVALVILVAGSLVAKFLARTVRSSVSEMGLTHPQILATFTHYAVIGFSIIAALSQLEIASSIVNILFTAFVSSVGLAIGLAFGLGGKDVAEEMTRSWYEKSKGPSSSGRKKAA